jgi:hypothetical protein
VKFEKEVTVRTPDAENIPKFMKQADYARYRGVSRKTVTIWKSKGLLDLNEFGAVDVRATDRRHIGHFGELRMPKDRQPR